MNKSIGFVTSRTNAFDQIVEFLEGLSKVEIDRLRRSDLIKDTATPPLPAGLLCAAALPSQAWNLVPEPYNKVWSPEDFEHMYESCIDTQTTVFDMRKFQKKCDVTLKGIRTKPKRKTGNTRSIETGSSHWTVISRAREPLQRPFTPPKPYTCEFHRFGRIMDHVVPLILPDVLSFSQLELLSCGPIDKSKQQNLQPCRLLFQKIPQQLYLKPFQQQ